MNIIEAIDINSLFCIFGGRNFMVEAYSNNVTVGTNASVPFNNIKIFKGCSVINSGSSFIINKPGVYKIDVSASVISSEEGEIDLEIRSNETNIPGAIMRSTSGDTTSVTNLSVSTLFIAEKNCCCNNIPFTIDVFNSGIPIRVNNFDISIMRFYKGYRLS